jgi:hypothetical protein
MGVISSSETFIHVLPTPRYVPEDGNIPFLAFLQIGKIGYSVLFILNILNHRTEMTQEECRLLGGETVWLLQEPTFERYVLHSAAD